MPNGRMSGAQSDTEEVKRLHLAQWAARKSEELEITMSAEHGSLSMSSGRLSKNVLYSTPIIFIRFFPELWEGYAQKHFHSDNMLEIEMTNRCDSSPFRMRQKVSACNAESASMKE